MIASNKAESGVVAGLGVLLGIVAKTLGDINGVVNNPLNFSLNVATIQDLKAVWPAIVPARGINRNQAVVNLENEQALEGLLHERVLPGTIITSWSTPRLSAW